MKGQGERTQKPQAILFGGCLEICKTGTFALLSPVSSFFSPKVNNTYYWHWLCGGVITLLLLSPVWQNQLSLGKRWLELFTSAIEACCFAAVLRQIICNVLYWPRKFDIQGNMSSGLNQVHKSNFVSITQVCECVCPTGLYNSLQMLHPWTLAWKNKRTKLSRINLSERLHDWDSSI